MKRYKMTLTILSPVHIGSGQDIDPTEYVVKNGVFYRIDLARFLSEMPPSLRAEFDRRVSDPNPFVIRDFIRNHVDPEKYACFKADAPAFESEYKNSLSNPNRQLEVSLFTRTPVTWRAYIPGSSIKGAIRTAVISELAKSKKPSKIDPKYFEKDVLGYGDARQDPFRCVKISDAMLPDSPTFIDKTEIFKLKKTSGADPSKIQMFYEQCFSMLDGEDIRAEGTLDIDDQLPKKSIYDNREKKEIPAVSMKLDAYTILKACRAFYQPKMQQEHDKFYRSSPELEQNSQKLLELLNKCNDSEFPLRIGRFSHVECTTVDEFREPYNSRGFGNSRTLSGGTMPMGWVKVRLEPIS
ncbi:MAG TPA: type III-A CRISPR-associated RAMP protein Csm5 [Anaerohalosphaeraceae bacterium]|nr:type III-A CRISPR-associated RAMP protein Csm5 [Anaerohalosphaeraceae bacterium]HOL89975.1 type III-A CRISPR-associated RAMP protein Csm5 [Anaerohalosphaeraceae bacterium]HPP56585.1 type III-A CRISPR-associated RAMP protein Csm5 [Anaerohalosphaeraceae bacterium]